MCRPSAFFIRSISNRCCARYPPYLRSVSAIFLSSRDPATGTWTSWAGAALSFGGAPPPAWGAELNAIDVAHVTIVGGGNDPSGPLVALVDLIGPKGVSFWTVPADMASGVEKLFARLPNKTMISVAQKIAALIPLQPVPYWRFGSFMKSREEAFAPSTVCITSMGK